MTRPEVLGPMDCHRSVDADTGADAIRALVQLAPIRTDEEPGGAEQAFQGGVDLLAENHTAGIRQQQGVARAPDLVVERVHLGAGDLDQLLVLDLPSTQVPGADDSRRIDSDRVE